MTTRRGTGLRARISHRDHLGDHGRRQPAGSQSLHADPTEAANGAYGGLIASGWHAASIFTRLYVTALLPTAPAWGGPGVDDLAWLVPVRAGDNTLGVVAVPPSPCQPSRDRIPERSPSPGQGTGDVQQMMLRFVDPEAGQTGHGESVHTIPAGSTGPVRALALHREPRSW